MAASILDACACAGKNVSPVFNTIDPTGPGIDAPGLVKHWAVTFDVQVRVLGLVLETGSSTIEELIAVLPGHPAPVEAIMAMVEAGFFVCEAGKVTPHTRINLPSRLPGNGAGGGTPPESGAGAPGGNDRNVVSIRSSVVYAGGTGFVPEIFIVNVADRRDLPHDINGPAVYCALRDTWAYTGKTGEGRQRLQAPHLKGYERVVVIRDAAGRMSERQAGVAERILGLIVGSLPGYKRAHPLPNGDHGSFPEYCQLRLFVAQALCLARDSGFGFKDVPILHMVMGAEGDPKRAAYVDPKQIDGTRYHLFAVGINAQATEFEGEWIVHAGSEVRSRVTPSAGSVVNTLRHEWRFSGILAEDNGRYRLTEPVSFDSGSGAANFLVGCKGPNLAGWTRHAPDEPDCPAPAV
ncbi:DUF4357 domain-containing protein [Devosia sp. BSSL-BM10]|uniref:DUF4357 domain-containing protein n=1 Tax=Devosia litorisediminis TaxID=2829817 RepID=A0A942E5V3_9HYPH|nr:DUF4357 domain-containing protein [Devosia litorisediminis]MBS3848555.1 DUF4357 domain-containing protein [Devosia litorisediminis]